MIQDTPTGSPESRTLQRLWYGGLLLAAVLRVTLINRHGLWNNELITYRVLWRDYGDIMAERLSVNHMPLYFLMEKAWTDVFGTSEASMRAIAAFFGWLAVWATGRLARRIGGLRLAVPVVFAGAVNQLWLSSSLEARMYSMLTWAAAESTDAWFAWARSGPTERPSRRRADLLRWALVTVAGIYIHMLYGAVLLLQAVDAAFRARRERFPLTSLVGAVGAVAVLCIPISVAWALNQNKFHNSPSDLEFRTPGVVLRKTVHLFLGDYRALDYALPRIATYLVFFAAIVGLIAVLRGRRNPSRTTWIPDAASLRDLRALGWAYLLFLIGLFIAQAFSSSSMLSEERYYAAFFPAVLILGGAGLMSLSSRWRLQASWVAAALLLQGVFTAAHYRGVGEGLREGVETVLAELPEDRGLVCILSGGGIVGLRSYYGRDLPRHVLQLDRSEKSLGLVQRQLDRYSEKFPEFWVLSYHEKEDTVWRVLGRPRSGYAALSEEKTFGKTKVGLFARLPYAEEAAAIAEGGGGDRASN